MVCRVWFHGLVVVAFTWRVLGIQAPPHVEGGGTSNLLVTNRSLPSLGEFTWSYKYRHWRDENKDTAPPDGLKVVFGLTTMLTETMNAFWGVAQDTWMKQRAVCTLGSPPRQRPDCSVYVIRVVGRPTVSNRDLFEMQVNGKRLYGNPRGGGVDGLEFHRGWEFQRDDVLWLNQSENMNAGKTFWLFHVLAREVPWATHIAKVDVDAYPYTSTLLSVLKSKQHCAGDYQYMGSPQTPRLCNPKVSLYQGCPATHCGSPELKCLNFHQGGMYILSKSLARDVTELDGDYANMRVGYEDQALGAAIRKFVLNTSACISFWFPHHAWHHEAWANTIVSPLKNNNTPSYCKHSCNYWNDLSYRNEFLPLQRKCGELLDDCQNRCELKDDCAIPS